MTNIHLPPLPESLGELRAQQFRAYATAAVLADREQRGKPVAWLNVERKAITQNGYEASCWRDQWPVVLPLYLAPPPVEQRKPLTREQVWALPGMGGWFPHDHYRLERVVRAVEAAHGIKEAT
jgi:hypothetical protein